MAAPPFLARKSLVLGISWLVSIVRLSLCLSLSCDRELSFFLSSHLPRSSLYTAPSLCLPYFRNLYFAIVQVQHDRAFPSYPSELPLWNPWRSVSGESKQLSRVELQLGKEGELGCSLWTVRTDLNFNFQVDSGPLNYSQSLPEC